MGLRSGDDMDFKKTIDKAIDVCDESFSVVKSQKLKNGKTLYLVKDPNAKDLYYLTYDKSGSGRNLGFTLSDALFYFKETVKSENNKVRDQRTVDEFKRKLLYVKVNPEKDRIFVKFIDEDDPVPYENEYINIKKTCGLLLRDKTITSINSEAKRVIQKYAGM